MDNIEGKAIHRRGPSRSELQKQISELVQQQAAIAEVLHAIATSPHELQPTLQTIVDSAARLCRAEAGTLRLVEKAGLRLVAQQLSPAILEEYLPPRIRRPDLGRTFRRHGICLANIRCDRRIVKLRKCPSPGGAQLKFKFTNTTTGRAANRAYKRL